MSNQPEVQTAPATVTPVVEPVVAAAATAIPLATKPAAVVAEPAKKV